MKHEDPHLSDQQLLLSLEGELPARDEKLVRAHLDACWACRARSKQLDDTIAGFVRTYRDDLDPHLPPVAGPKALLRAQLDQLSEGGHAAPFHLPGPSAWMLAAGIVAVCALGLLLFTSGRNPEPRGLVVSSPDSTLTPGATLLASRLAVCAQRNVKNKAVPADLQRAVFREYGIQGADPRAYEVDYLVTPALGGADDIHNLWPHSHLSTVWNAEVKDALEDRLRQMVCEGSLELAEAQHDIAANWIAAYKKYFHTDHPLPEHAGTNFR
ncbi:MAG: hypothetical protein ABI806_16565 [Candidatus Solibacter sp.]